MKIDTLLQKVELFEKLAVYGDRQSFLQAISQRVIVPNDPNAPPGQGGTHTVDLNAPAAPAAPTQQASLPKLVVPNAGPPGSGGHWSDPSQVTDEAAPPVDRDQTLLMPKQLNAPATPEKESPSPQAVARPPVFNQDLQDVQNYLNQQMTQGGAGQAVAAPITPDGLWGPETAKMLALWGKKINMPLDPKRLFEFAQAQLAANKNIAKSVTGPALDAAQRSG